MHTPPTSTELTYPRSLVGVSTYLHRLADLPDLAERLETSGFHTLSRTEVIGHGHADMSRAIDNLLSGRAHRRAGAPLRREPDKIDGDHPLAAGDTVAVALGAGLFRALSSPCLVLTAGRRDTDGLPLTDSFEMIYGTLPGHMESGEERFAVTLENDGTVTATVSAFSRPARLLTRAGGPVARFAQRRMAMFYIRGMSAQ
ncbi:MAG TPA: DUF1990 domain-containing protein [Candidatus Corynebacterium avicola]|uniref:DUF1990 domain-containing protein n=1 Tax=Candidatus Corynebacterium avicola TaxID=2838527 RepID=A0A9D1RSZ5_9CORY|nr:DUF1990 domain-containing protein [Candidatus Corynebacterium avicola]